MSCCVASGCSCGGRGYIAPAPGSALKLLFPGYRRNPSSCLRRQEPAAALKRNRKLHIAVEFPLLLQRACATCPSFGTCLSLIGCDRPQIPAAVAFAGTSAPSPPPPAYLHRNRLREALP